VSDELELIRGSGNVFRDFGRTDADARQLKALLAAHIIKLLDRRKMSVRAAAEVTGIAAADFSRVRKAKLDRFTIDRLMRILDRLDQEVDIAVTVRPRTVEARSARPSHAATGARESHERVRLR
jgi:predicted XRE-type DNA-binding protein